MLTYLSDQSHKQKILGVKENLCKLISDKSEESVSGESRTYFENICMMLKCISFQKHFNTKSSVNLGYFPPPLLSVVAIKLKALSMPVKHLLLAALWT